MSFGNGGHPARNAPHGIFGREGEANIMSGNVQYPCGPLSAFTSFVREIQDLREQVAGVSLSLGGKGGYEVGNGRRDGIHHRDMGCGGGIACGIDDGTFETTV